MFGLLLKESDDAFSFIEIISIFCDYHFIGHFFFCKFLKITYVFNQYAVFSDSWSCASTKLLQRPLPPIRCCCSLPHYYSLLYYLAARRRRPLSLFYLRVLLLQAS